MYKFVGDRYPGRKIWFGDLKDTVSGFEVISRARMKPTLLQIRTGRWIRVDGEEILFLEETEEGKVFWVTLRGRFRDLESGSLSEALKKAGRCAVLVRVSAFHAVAPSRILGIRLKRKGYHLIEVESEKGVPVLLPLDPERLGLLEECLEALDLGGGFLVTGPDDPE